MNLVPLETGEEEAVARLRKDHSLSGSEQAQMCALLNLCDEETRAHSWRIAYLARAMACYLRLSTTEIHQAFLAALLHDIGKAEIPLVLLQKQGPLSTREWHMIRLHPEVGQNLLQQAGGIFSELAPIVFSHHERWDGEGYPRGLRGEQIPLLARLLTVVDSFDAMTSQRPYQRSFSDIEACLELQRCSGSQYDPLFVDAFLCMLSLHNPLIPSWSLPSFTLATPA